MVITDTADVQVVGGAGNDTEAVRLTGELTPDVVVMDIRMPGMDGVEAIRLITIPGQEGTFAIPPRQPPNPRETGRLVSEQSQFLEHPWKVVEGLRGTRARHAVLNCRWWAGKPRPRKSCGGSLPTGPTARC